MQIYGYMTEEALRRRVRKTVLHEFRHHLESLAGEKDLEIEDAIPVSYTHLDVYKRQVQTGVGGSRAVYRGIQLERVVR